MALPFPDETFEYGICQFGVMFFPDKQTAFREALRVLRPGGQFLFNVWGDTEGTARKLVQDVVGECLSRDPTSLVAPEYNDIATVCAELTGAGFISVTAEKVSKRTRSGSAREAAIANCHGGLLRAQIAKFAPDRLDEITDAVAAAIAARFGHGLIDAPIHAILFTGVRPVD
jgi:SAM-dependent methyltransferase